MNTIDKLSYASKIANVSAGEKLFFSMLPLLFCLISSSYVLHSTVFIVMSIFSINYSALNFKRYFKLLLVPSTFIILGLISIIFNVGANDTKDVICSFRLASVNLCITYIGISTALNIFLRSLASISCFYFLILNTPMNNLLSYLQQKKVSSLLLTLTELIYRFSFVLYGQYERIRTAQLSRLGYLSFKNGIKSVAEILAMTFESSIIKVNSIDNMLNSRCFDGSFAMITDPEMRTDVLKMKGIIINAFLLMILLLEVYFKWK
ncbi:MAG: cobalt ECF transporter T component CbiQ [Clostridia bacterium]